MELDGEVVEVESGEEPDLKKAATLEAELEPTPRWTSPK